MPTDQERQEADERARKASEDLKKKQENAKARLDDEQKERDENNKRAAKVMEESRPTPTQRENDLAKLGAFNPDDREPDENPSMPSLEKQREEAAEKQKQRDEQYKV